MSRFELISFADSNDLARTAAGAWLDEVEAASRSDAPYCVALSGGRIAGRFLSATADLAKARGLTWKSAQFFWSDERCVGPTDPESNYGLARQHLLGPLRIPDRQIHRVRGEVSPEAAAEEAAVEICRIAPRRAGGQPTLDLIFLGLGEDGHVASLFPGESQAVMASKAVFRPVIAPKPPPRRITLGYPAIAAARQVWVLASGSGKEYALRESLTGAGATPLGRVLSLRDRTQVFTDIVDVKKFT